MINFDGKFKEVAGKLRSPENSNSTGKVQKSGERLAGKISKPTECGSRLHSRCAQMMTSGTDLRQMLSRYGKLHENYHSDITPLRHVVVGPGGDDEA